jgi:hypothetical protein
MTLAGMPVVVVTDAVDLDSLAEDASAYDTPSGCIDLHSGAGAYPLLRVAVALSAPTRATITSAQYPRAMLSAKNAECASARAAHVVGRLEKGAERLLELLVIAEAPRDFLGDEHGALRPAPQTAAVRLNGALEPLGG